MVAYLQVIICFSLLYPSIGLRIFGSLTTSRSVSNPTENELLKILETDTIGRGAKTTPEVLELIGECILKLESESSKSIRAPTKSQVLEGCWKLMYTSSPGTNSPIQRTFTAVDGISIYQVVNLFNTQASLLTNGEPDVSNVVCFGDSSRLRITALASTATDPRIVPRAGDGKIFGLNIFGVSSSATPRDVDDRIDFAFQEAFFEFVDLPISIPYPVPFKLLGDEAKGWIDVTYMSPKLRISRGNKGTIFVLVKADLETDPRAALAAIKDVKLLKSKMMSTKSVTGVMPTAPSSPWSPVPSPPITGNKLPNLPLTKPVLSFPWDKKQEIKSPKVGRVGIILPAQLGTADDYEELAARLQQTTGRPFYTVQLSRLDWPVGLLPSLLTKDYLQGTLKPSSTLAFYFKKIDAAVETALREDPNAEVTLLAHSIGGWVARAWLGEWCDPLVKQRVRALVTLGSPHNPPPQGSAVASIDQTRGLLTYINNNFPGAYEPGVKYTCVVGTSVQGALKPSPEALLAYSSYAVLCGDGSAKGDGIIPLETSCLEGAEIIEIEDVKHSNYLPTPGKSIMLPLQWYGSVDAIEKWVSAVL